MIYKLSALLNLDGQIEKKNLGGKDVKSSLNIVVTLWYLYCVSACTVTGDSGVNMYTERWSYSLSWKSKIWKQDINEKNQKIKKTKTTKI